MVLLYCVQRGKVCQAEVDLHFILSPSSVLITLLFWYRLNHSLSTSHVLLYFINLINNYFLLILTCTYSEDFIEEYHFTGIILYVTQIRIEFI